MAVERIASRDNLRVKDARAVRDGRIEGRVLVEGVRLAEDALASGIKVVTAFAVSGFGTSDREAKLLRAINDREIEVVECTANVFDSIADTRSPQGIILIAERPREAALDEIDPACGVYLYLDRISDPSNLGAVMRTAEAAGVAAIFISKGSTDPFSPKALRASMGSAFRVRTVGGVEFTAFSEKCRASNIRTVGAALGAADDIYIYDWSAPSALIIGSEAAGLSDEIIQQLDATVEIPMNGEVESLNLAVSAAVILFEAKRQRTIK